jgi:hypothetical protein
MWVLGPLIMSGYLIQVVTHVGWLEAIAWTHLGTGAVYLVSLFVHHRVVRELWARRRGTRIARMEIGTGAR